MYLVIRSVRETSYSVSVACVWVYVPLSYLSIFLSLVPGGPDHRVTDVVAVEVEAGAAADEEEAAAEEAAEADRGTRRRGAADAAAAPDLALGQDQGDGQGLNDVVEIAREMIVLLMCVGLACRNSLGVRLFQETIDLLLLLLLLCC